MDHGIDAQWRLMIVLAWLLSPLLLIVGALAIAALVEFCRRPWQRWQNRPAPRVAAPPVEARSH